ncbi:hypothetical protein SAMN04489742_2703 [Arthrobacter crystallopoietes]|uniref:Uncharacterized protein n=1 Tax=Crystallibacter crystallopoietes TaxID=37928 RepID=A0A1H1E0M5_9MICC|nr:hypothetical protein AC20117_03925 [Arthrobacter crystallopoietes]SDQ82193.1 hypothetical protein SAMN04489742_2703 [Arthrobacter crystallopoietes]
MSLQPPEYWLKIHNIELQQLMAQAERTRQRSRYQGNGTALRSPKNRAKSVAPVKSEVVAPAVTAYASDNRARAWFHSLMPRLRRGALSAPAPAGRQPADCCA